MDQLFSEVPQFSHAINFVFIQYQFYYKMHTRFQF